MVPQNWPHLLLMSLFLTSFLFDLVQPSEDKTKKQKIKAQKIKKDIKDYSETDIYHLLDQWNENDDDFDPADADEDDPRLKSPPKVQFDPKMMQTDPQAMLKMSKKGKAMMMFATVAGNPKQKETETISALWQQSLHNAHIQLERYVISDNRVLFSLKDGSFAWDIKDFLLKRQDCAMVEFENQKFPCAGASKQKTEL